jgi:hypothetical protein
MSYQSMLPSRTETRLTLRDVGADEDGIHSEEFAGR